MIRFDFNLTKALQALAYVARRIPGVEKVKITKLIYLADKDHFLRHGHPITGDMQYAMPWGPVPSDCLHALDGELWPDADAAFRYLNVINNRILLLEDPGIAALGESEIAVIDETLAKHGRKYWKALVEETHKLPEYVEVFVPKTSTLIPYELILKHSGDPKHFRMRRPVISKEMREHMACPFPA